MAESKKISQAYEENLATVKNAQQVQNILQRTAGGGGENPNTSYTLTGEVSIEEYKENDKIISYWLGLPTEEGKIISLRAFMGTQNTTKFIKSAINETCTETEYKSNKAENPIKIIVEEETEDGVNLKTAYEPTKFPTRIIAQLADKIQSKEFNLTGAKVTYIGKAVTQTQAKTKYHFGENFVLPGFQRAVTYQCWNIDSKPNNVTPEKQD